MVQNKERDWTVELMRIVGCLMVIGCHTVPGSIQNLSDRGVNTGLLLSCFVGDGVAIFWAITGFFLFSNFNYKKLLKRTAWRILLPYAVYTVFIFYLYDAFISHVPLTESLSHSAKEYFALFCNALTLEVVPQHSEHLWYVVTYLILIAVSPLFCGFGIRTADDKVTAKWCVLFLVALLLLNDFSCRNTLGISHHGAGSLCGALIFVLYGNILYHNRDKIIWKGWIVLAPILFVAITVLRYAVAAYNIGVICWYTTFGIINTTLVAAFCQSLSKIKATWTKPVTVLGSYTFAVYVVHFFVIQLLFSKGLFTKLSAEIIGADNRNLFLCILYHLTAIFIVFIVSIMLCVFIRFVRKGLLVFVAKLRTESR